MNADSNEHSDWSTRAFPALKNRSRGRVPEEHAEGVRLEGHGCIDLQSPIANRQSPII
jgi:hypothetical protein